MTGNSISGSLPSQAWSYLRGSLRSDIKDVPKGKGKDYRDLQIRRLTDWYEELRNGGRSGTSPVPEVSVVIPVRASESADKFLAAVESLLENVDAPPTEVIVVLNEAWPAAEIRSSQIAEIAGEIGLRTVIVSYYDNPEYRGVERPRNIFIARQTGFERARAPLVLAADIDDRFSTSWLRAYADAFAEDPGLLLAYGPVQIGGLTSLPGRIMSGASILAKAFKVLLKYPPYAGHNHAMRRDVMTIVPDIYTKRILWHENEIPVVVGRAMERNTDDGYVACISGAVIRTDYSQLDQSAWGAVRWLYKSFWRNVQQMKRLWAP